MASAFVNSVRLSRVGHKPSITHCRALVAGCVNAYIKPMIDDLYSSDILALSATLRNEHLDAPCGHARKLSKLCGSWVEVDLVMDAGAVTDCAVRVQACALGQAATAILKAHIIGARLDELIAARDGLRAMLKENGAAPTGRFAELKKLAGVQAYPARHASTLLAFDAAVDAAAQCQGL